MKRLELTNEFIESHPKPEKTIAIHDSKFKNLAIRLFPTGTKSFIYRYSHHGTSKRFTIGKFPQYDIERARQEASQLYKKVQDGIDLIAERKRLKRQNRSITVRELIDIYKRNKLPELRDSTKNTFKNILENQIVQIHSIHLSEITKGDIKSILEKKSEAGHKPMANQIRIVLSNLVNYGKEHGYFERNFVSEISPYKTKPSDITNDDYDFKQIYTLWVKFTEYGYPVGYAFKWLLMTGQRRNEVLRMQWDQIDKKQGVWKIPGHVAKNGNEHEVYLSKYHMRMLNEIGANYSTSKWVFQSRVKNHARLTTLYHHVLKIRESTDIDFRTHNLRGTIITHLASLGFSEFIAGKVVNHGGTKDRKKTAITRRYNQHKYVDEKIDALKKWTLKLYSQLHFQSRKDASHKVEYKVIDPSDRKVIDDVSYNETVENRFSKKDYDSIPDK